MVEGEGTEGGRGLAGALTITSFREVHGSPAISYRSSLSGSGPASHVGREAASDDLLIALASASRDAAPISNHGPTGVLLVNALRFSEPHPISSVQNFPPTPTSLRPFSALEMEGRFLVFRWGMFGYRMASRNI